MSRNYNSFTSCYVARAYDCVCVCVCVCVWGGGGGAIGYLTTKMGGYNGIDPKKQHFCLKVGVSRQKNYMTAKLTGRGRIDPKIVRNWITVD